MEDKKNKQEFKKRLNRKFETASELGIIDAGIQGVKAATLNEDEVRRIIAKARSRFIGFK